MYLYLWLLTWFIYTPITFIALFLSKYLLWWWWWGGVCASVHRDQRKTLGHLSSPSTFMWVLGIKVCSPGFCDSASTLWDLLPAWFLSADLVISLCDKTQRWKWVCLSLGTSCRQEKAKSRDVDRAPEISPNAMCQRGMTSVNSFKSHIQADHLQSLVIRSFPEDTYS